MAASALEDAFRFSAARLEESEKCSNFLKTLAKLEQEHSVALIKLVERYSPKETLTVPTPQPSDPRPVVTVLTSALAETTQRSKRHARFAARLGSHVAGDLGEATRKIGQLEAPPRYGRDTAEMQPRCSRDLGGDAEDWAVGGACSASKRQATSHKLPATSCKLQATSYQIQATSYQVQATRCKLQAASYKLQATRATGALRGAAPSFAREGRAQSRDVACNS